MATILLSGITYNQDYRPLTASVNYNTLTLGRNALAGKSLRCKTRNGERDISQLTQESASVQAKGRPSSANINEFSNSLKKTLKLKSQNQKINEARLTSIGKLCKLTK